MNFQNLIAVLQEARALLSNPENNFIWSSWEDSSDAIAEVNGLLAQLETEELPSRGSLEVLFLPTGPIQEVSLSSGWGDEFIELAGRFDAAMRLTYAKTPLETCDCFVIAQSQLIELVHFGLDSIYAEVSVLGCKSCGQLWLKYFYENEGYTGSGRWYLGAIAAGQQSQVNLENARQMLEGLSWYFVGGSYYGGVVSKGSGNIRINL